MTVASRLARVVDGFANLDSDDPIDALLVTNLTNVRYLTGFTGSAGVLVVTTDGALLVTDGRYTDQVATEVRASGSAVEIEIAGVEQDKVVLSRLAGASRIGLEAMSVTWSQQRKYAELFVGREVVATTDLVERCRIRKDAGEIARITAAAAIADAAFAEVLPMMAEGATELEFAQALDGSMRRLGASGPSFETIVASGPNGAMPHARPTHRKIGEGELVVVDFGAVVDGYCSDMTRTVAVGSLTAERRSMLDAVLESQQAGVDTVGAGVQAKDVDTACRDVLVRRGLGEYFSHSTGHGVGLDIHEAPRVAATSDATLDAGFVVTVEPGVYVSPQGGVRIEDTVVVTDSGCIALTTTPKNLTLG